MSLSLPRFAGAAAATLVALCAAGAYPTHRIAGGDGVTAMAIAAVVSLLGALVGFLPSRFAAARVDARVQAAMLGIGLRLAVTVAAVFAVLVTGATPARVPFVAWIAIDYVALLVVETLVVLRATRGPKCDGGPVAP